jgi:hypothetical protein
MDPSIDPRLMEQVTWLYALKDFAEAVAMADFICEHRPSGSLFSACVTGMVVCYMRPFKADKDKGLSKLRSLDFFKLMQKEAEHRHKELEVARDKLLAQLDMTEWIQKYKEGKLPHDPSSIAEGHQGKMIETYPVVFNRETVEEYRMYLRASHDAVKRLLLERYKLVVE